MILTLRFRDPADEHDDRTGPVVSVRVGFFWFEGPDDLHIQFGSNPGSDNFCPVEKKGEYMAPHPTTGVMTPVYSFEFRDGLAKHLVSRGYRRLLEKAWPSPNRNNVPYTPIKSK